MYHDRLVDDEDRTWLYQLMNSIVKDHFNVPFDQVFGQLKQGDKVKPMQLSLKWSHMSHV